jgi:DNA-binding response OmpR family regulator
MKRIVVVEDDPAITDTLEFFFMPIGYQLMSYRNGDAIISGLDFTPDLFLLDRQLSGIDGLDLCRFIKSNKSTKNIPVIIMSASPEVIPLSKSAGADDVIIKPYELVQMRSLISKYLS